MLALFPGELDIGVKAWAFSSSQYVRAAIQNLEDFIVKDKTKRWKLPNKLKLPCAPHTDQSLMSHPS
jgi:hypothetical protein